MLMMTLYCRYDGTLRITLCIVSSSARNLGFIFDSDMSFTDQINSLSNSCHFHIRDIRRIRHLLPLSAATALANSLVSSKLDHCNSLYNGISQANCMIPTALLIFSMSRNSMKLFLYCVEQAEVRNPRWRFSKRKY